MLENIMSNPKEIIKYAVMIVLLIVLLIIYRSMKTGDGRIFGNTKAENLLKREYSIIDEETFSPDKDDYRLIVGMCMHIQTALEKEKSPNEAFLALPEVKRNAMTLGYLFEDSQVTLSNFFRSNGEPLLSAAKNAAENVIGGEYAEIFDRMFPMLDENNEDVSVNEVLVKQYDSEFKELMKNSGASIYKTAADYIRANKADFLN